MSKKKNEKPKVDWADSRAKRKLKKCLENGEIPLDREEMEPRVVYMQHPELPIFRTSNSVTA